MSARRFNGLRLVALAPGSRQHTNRNRHETRKEITMPKQATLSAAPKNSDAKTPDVAEILDVVRKHLDNDAPERALEVIRRANNKSSWLRNAMAVCHLRLGD